MSKKYFTTAFLLTFLFFTFSGVSAQENILTTEDLDIVINDLVNTANQKIKDKTRRVTTTSTFSTIGSEVSTRKYKTIWEIIPPDREHFVSENESVEGVKRYEFIRIGDKRFVRENNGEWKEESGNGRGSGNGAGAGIDAVIERTVERRVKKGETVNNQTADLYEIVTVTKYIYPNKTITNSWKQSYWIDKNGLFVRTEDEFQNGEANTISRTVRDYEYDSNIKIEAPIKP